MNFSTHKIIESAHVKIAEKTEEESNKELKDYIRFVYSELDTLPNLCERKDTSSPKSPKSLTIIKLHTVQPKSLSEGPKSQ